MPSTDDSTPNFDFLSGDASADGGGWTPPADSALDLLERPTETEAPAASDEESSEPEAASDALEVPVAPTPTEPVTKPVSPEAPLAPAEDPVEQPVDFEPEETAVSPARRERSSSKKPTRSKASKPRVAAKPSSSRSTKQDARFTLSGPMAISLVSYAVMATILLAYLLMFRTEHQLESLPDRAPLGPDEFRYVPESAAVAPGHRISIGDSVRFGHIRVEPVRVTRSQARLEHYAGRDGLAAPPAGEDIIKLWVKLTNESTDQKIAPFDRLLVYDRRVDDGFVAHSDQYVVPAAEQGTDEPNVDMYDLSPDGEWDLAGQEFPVLKPGESVTTYLAAGPEELDRLTGASVWRILMRKGYNERAGHGVLTLIDVEFDAAAAETES